MAKKNFNGVLPKVRKNGTDGLFSTGAPDDPAKDDSQAQSKEVTTTLPAEDVTTTKKKVGRPPKEEKDKVSYYYARTSIIANKAKLQKLEEIAFREKVMMKEIFELAFDLVIEQYEKKNGEIVEFTKGKPRDLKDKLFS